ncbi:hypothetical protein FB45DRAFT_1057491 [Roridomyces roridus]|uniref:Arrestin C-terminal-like domain-containing protein n=1 Tax=Roridomyces roridus TaxID=1738132 RepID=A0AAD7BW62_9AGAR|nr:hypothetical protein FB45DRAFT_1057491 [Roridomyces roridus]
MSQVKLTLRPPPNVDFVHGYPGIPPGPDRPQAAVKGAIEVRVGPQGAKAKWVRIELRKVETLPGGGVVNTFHDFVGPSPVNLWTSSEEYGILNSQDFPFSIRIPESTPPSIDLQNRAGINYELLASVCTKGKKGFLRKRKSVVVSTQADILIDKHELHSTWPVYCQPETRNITQEGVTLSVERNSTCYGPGDRVSLFATVKSDALHTVILRGFELTLKETTTFRAAPYTSGKKTAPQTRVVAISENKFPVNATLYGGMQHRTELNCMVSPDHTTTTLNAARHIDITYTLSVRASMGTGTPLIMDLPLIVSNWQRAVSTEAIRRIGHAPSLSLLPVNANRRAEEPPQPQTFAGHSAANQAAAATNAYNTMPATQSNGSSPRPVDEFGGYQPTHKTTSSRDGPGASTARPGTGRRPSSSEGKRFTITNAETPPEEPRRKPEPPASAHRVWPSAEDEKQRLYDQARANAERAQATASQANTPPPARAVTPPSQNNRWLSAEEEKQRLFDEAQKAVERTQRMDFYSSANRNGSSTHGRNHSNDSGSSRPAANAPAGGSSPVPASQKSTPKIPHYMTAEQEKAALRRYEEAKQAVSRVQGYAGDEGADSGAASGSGPIAYDSLFPSAAAPSGSSPNVPNGKPDSPPPFDAAFDAAAAQQPVDDAPPPFSGAGLSEKEILRRRLDAQDSEARQTAAAPQPPPPRKGSNSTLSRPTPAPPSGGKILTALEEKAMLKSKYDTEDAGPKPKTNGHCERSRAEFHLAFAVAALEYIQETQEEDARVSRFVASAVPTIDEPVPPLSPSASIVRKSTSSPGLDIAPFTPFTPGFVPGPPPPLPQKPAEP